MTRILARLVWFTLFSLLAAFAVGWVSFFRGSRHVESDPTFILHIYLGLGAGIVTLGVHCLVIMYFLGTGRWVKEVALAYRIPDDPWPKLTRELKRQTFPSAMVAAIITIATSAAGAGVQTQSWPWPIHAGLALLTLLANARACLIAWRSVRTNAGIIDEVMREVDRIRAAHGLASNAEALKQQD